MWIVHRHMEGVGVVFPVGHAGDDAVLFLVDADETAGQTLGGGGQTGVVQLVSRWLPRRMNLRMKPHDLQAQILGWRDPRRDACRAGPSAHSARPMKPMDRVPCLSTSRTSSVRAQLFGVDPHALRPSGRGSCRPSCWQLDLQPLQQLIDAPDCIMRSSSSKNQSDVALGLDGDAGQVDGGEAQVAAAGGRFPGWGRTHCR